MKKEGYWIIRTYQSGRIGEKIKYWVPGARPTKSKRKMRSDIRKQKQNEVDATRRLARVINCNFKGGDLWDALTYDPENYNRLMERIPDHLDGEQARDFLYALADHELENYIRRCRRACKKAGLDFKFIAITSDMNGETQEPVRIHHHIITTREAAEVCRSQWQNGGIEKDYVWDETDHYGLAKYVMDQVRRIPDAKKYRRSRNLLTPDPKDRLAKTGKEVQPPKDAEIIYRAAYTPGRPQYVRYILPEKKEKTGGPDCRPENTGGEECQT